MNDKICPIMSTGACNYKCLKHECAWFVFPYTTEGLKCDGMCAIEMIAMKNSEGLYRV